MVGFRLGSWMRARAGLAAVAAPAAVAIGLLLLGPDLVFIIPWPVRKRIGRVLFAGAAALALARFVAARRPGDWPDPGRDGFGPPPGAGGRAGAWLPWALAALGASLALPLLSHCDEPGFWDWDYFLEKYEAIRITVVEYGQVPWWDPWCRGGVPLGAGPQVGLVSPATPLVLAFGAARGLVLATVAFFLIGVEGARRLASAWLGEPWGAAFAGLIYGLNGGVLCDAVAGYYIPMSYAALPWVVLGTFRLERSRRDALGLGGWLAFSALNGVQYLTLYAAMISALMGFRALWQLPGPRRRRLAVHAAIAASLVPAAAGWRLATTGLVVADFPRPFRSFFDEPPASILVHLLHRPDAREVAAGVSRFWETTCYIGPVALLAAAAGLALGWRWWHTLALVAGLLASGSGEAHHAGYWLAEWPLFATLHVVTRWRFVALLGLALSAGSSVAWLRRRTHAAPRLLAAAVVVAVGCDYTRYGFEILPLAFRAPAAANLVARPPTAEIRQVEHGLGYPALRLGYGVVRGYEPLLGYYRGAATARTWLGHQDDIGESWAEGRRPIAPASWSPNRLVFRTGPGGRVFVNQNPGSWWYANGAQLTPGLRCAEMAGTLEARADASGLLVLEVRPRGLRAGLALHAAGLAALAILLRATRRVGAGTHAEGER